MAVEGLWLVRSLGAVTVVLLLPRPLSPRFNQSRLASCCCCCCFGGSSFAVGPQGENSWRGLRLIDYYCLKAVVVVGRH